MNILLVVPHTPDTFLSFNSILSFVDKKAACPPLGMITVSAMLPKTWNKKLVDLNTDSLQDSDILWADYVFISATYYIQKKSVNAIIDRCVQHGVKIVGGGPVFTQEHENYPQIDHFVLNEAEITLPLFLYDLRSGCPKSVYKTDGFADMTQTPVPDFHLLAIDDYVNMNIQVSRGCPFSCEFCEITALLGRKVRMKRASQIIDELQRLYDLHWRGQVYIVDDNFIGDRKEVKNNLLPAMQEWMERHNYPFTFNTQASIDLSDDAELMSLMVKTGFSSVFIGIETPDENSLQECNKRQNRNRNLLQSVRKLQNAGLQVTAGFILGFDNDTPTTFQRQIDFIQQSGIVTAVVGLLNVAKKTALYRRYESENRIITEASGNTTDLSLNYVPVMNPEELVKGYKKVIQAIYDTKPYYRRIQQFLQHYRPDKTAQAGLTARRKAFVKSLYALGVTDAGRKEFWKLLVWTFFRRPRLLADALVLAVCGLHFRNIFGLR